MEGTSKVAFDDYPLNVAFLINAQIYLLYQQSYANIFRHEAWFGGHVEDTIIAHRGGCHRQRNHTRHID